MHTIANVLNATRLFDLKWLNLCHVNFTSITCFLKELVPVPSRNCDGSFLLIVAFVALCPQQPFHMLLLFKHVLSGELILGFEARLLGSHRRDSLGCRLRTGKNQSENQTLTPYPAWYSGLTKCLFQLPFLQSF